MKRFLLSSILFVPVFSNSQNFTYGSVYNYDISDTIVTGYREYTMFGQNDPPEELIYQVFTAKNYSSDSSSISYQYTKYHVSRSPTYPYPWDVLISNENLNVINLDSSITQYYNFTVDTCTDISDTSFVTNCSFNVREISKEPANNSVYCSFEANRYYDEYIEGVGAFWDYYVGSA
ncbi:MAG: hypothetical protein JNL60_04240, partial [Bacteroidia bacterium]|nr:hypothetical protein [Bacteroidia bacterium]